MFNNFWYFTGTVGKYLLSSDLLRRASKPERLTKYASFSEVSLLHGSQHFFRFGLSSKQCCHQREIMSMPLISFDSIAHAYDSSRGYPPMVAQQIGKNLDQIANGSPQTKYLEVGVGTGRIAIPLVSLGRAYTGVDISAKMLVKLEENLKMLGWSTNDTTVRPWGSFSGENLEYQPTVYRYARYNPSASMRLVISDVEQLPFYEDTFDIVIAAYIFHLVDGWQEAIQEILRVLRSGGVFLRCWDKRDRSDINLINKQWDAITYELGWTDSRPKESINDLITQWLQKRGLQSEEQCILTWEEKKKPREELQDIANRRWSRLWNVPNSIFNLSLEYLYKWATQYYGDLDSDLILKRSFIVNKTSV
jgi:ubiquinone/menaquinone biosynthesis C-methylase UbiE